jgi:hypothetical protein
MAKNVKPTSAQGIRASGQNRKRQLERRRKFFLNILPVASAAVTSFLDVVLVSQPQVPTSTAQAFFDNYYNEVTHADYRKVLYREDLTRNFQESMGSDWEDYSNWWKTWKQVDIRKVESDPHNPLEFNVWLRYYPVRGPSNSEEDDFTLVCSGFWASLEARIPALGCSVNHIQIQSQLFVSGAI